MQHSKVHAAPNVIYTKVNGTYRYVPYLYMLLSSKYVTLFPGYTRKEDAEEAVRNLLASNATLRATPLEYVNQTQESGS